VKILITGFPGTGKTSIAKELQKRGRYAYDPESMRAYMRLEDRETGRPIKMPESAPRGWYDAVGSFNWDSEKITKLLHTHETVFICSLAGNMYDFLDQFDHIFVLTLDDIELQQRLERRGTGLSTQDTQLADILLLHHKFEEKMSYHPKCHIVSVRPKVPEVANAILANLAT
jgi:gluconate kinase